LPCVTINMIIIIIFVRIEIFTSGCDYEKCSFLCYRSSVRTSQETHYVSVTEPSWLMQCKIRVFRGGDYEECRLFGCDAVWLM
jgi:hypothetical protein